MASLPVKTRFAPSPTGQMHVGNLRTALFNALYAAREQGTFLLRLEDTDQQRSQDQYAEQLMDDLRWLGLNWSEGPGVGTNGQSYRQSRRSDIYRKYYDDLLGRGLLYPCFCSQTELKLSRKAQIGAGQPPRYAGTCAGLAESEVQARLDQGQKPVLRFRVPAGQQVEFNDLVRGLQTFATDSIGDFVVRRADGSPAFFFCNAVDDALMAVTHVLRGEDHLSNTPRQLLLLQALGLRAPVYGHINLIVAADGAPLSKRHGSRSVEQLRGMGLLPGALLNYLARLGHTYDSNEYLGFEQLAEHFDPARLGRAPARYDENQIHHWQREALAAESAATLWDWMSSEVDALVPASAREDFVTLVRENIVNPAEARYWALTAFGKGIDRDEDAVRAIRDAGAGFFQSALEGLEKNDHDYAALLAHLKTETGLKGKALFMPLRAALTGKLHGPELGRLYSLLPADEVRARLADCLDVPAKPEKGRGQTQGISE